MLVGISGPPRAGKGLLTQLACLEFGFVQLSISSIIRNVAHQLVKRDFSEDEKDAPLEVLNCRSPRDLYVHIGKLNKFIPTIWVEHVWEQQYRGPSEHYVVDSVGTQEQWSGLRDLARLDGLSTYLIEVNRPGRCWDNRVPVQDPSGVFGVANDGSTEIYLSRCRELLNRLVAQDKQPVGTR